MIHDTHAHLDLLLYKLGLIDIERDIPLDQQEALLKELLQQNDWKQSLHQLIAEHEFVIHPGVSSLNSVRFTRLFKEFAKIHFLLGAHPEIITTDFDVNGFVNEQQEIIHNYFPNLKQARIVGVGECGLDYFYSQNPDIITKQKELFISQIKLAISHKLPLIIHCRDAFDDLFDILDQYPAIHGSFLIHCFTGNTQQAQEVIKRGGFLGIGGIVTFKNSQELQEAVANTPLEHIMLETDLPFLAPIPYRGKICLPEYITEVAYKVADLQQITYQDVWQQSRTSSKTLFNIDSSPA